ncbi:MAG: hypothetical protein ACREJ4_10865 [Candidatus Methylomirabilaceae bacterium]
MRLSLAMTIIVAALIIAAALVVHARVYQVVPTGPDTGYKIHRLTGEVWRLSGSTSQRVQSIPLGLEKDFGK